MDDMVAALRANHIRRLRNGECTVYAGLAFLDVLVNVERIADQCSNIGVYTLAQSHPAMKTHHDYIPASASPAETPCSTRIPGNQQKILLEAGRN